MASLFLLPLLTLSLSLLGFSSELHGLLGSVEEETVRMLTSHLVKQEFLKKWITGLEICDSAVKSTSVVERKNAIKLSADIAIAIARRGATCWSRALINQATSSNATQKHLVRRILNKARYRPEKLNISPKTNTNIVRSCKNILKKSCVTRRRKKIMNKRLNLSSCLAKRLVKKRTTVLKSLVPGGELMDDKCLIRETLDYIVYLRAQVQVMRTVAADTSTGGGGGATAGTLASNDDRNNNLMNK